jgi:hypothetical protein
MRIEMPPHFLVTLQVKNVGWKDFVYMKIIIHGYLYNKVSSAAVPARATATTHVRLIILCQVLQYICSSLSESLEDLFPTGIA